MMTNVALSSFSGTGLDFGLLAAALILVLGIWRGRRDLGQRAALGVLGTLAATTLLVFAVFLLIQWSPANSSLLTLTVFNLISLLVGFLPLYVAANWVEVILRQTRPE